jgi:hypothetical protein
MAAPELVQLDKKMGLFYEVTLPKSKKKPFLDYEFA